MPPGHHSSSHHSSSHHSSSHRSSSHHSSSSHRSGPSSHSSSTHTAARSVYGSSYRSSYSGSGNSLPHRSRINQPKGYNKGGIKTYHCRHHDYVYYPVGWYNSETNTQYKSGYYDEDGNCYDYVAFKEGDSYTTLFECEYCDTQVKVKWEEGVSPSCPNCGAVLKEAKVAKDEIVNEEIVNNSYYNNNSYSPVSDILSTIKNSVKWIVVSFIAIIIISGIGSYAGWYEDEDDYSSSYYNDNGYEDYNNYDNNYSSDVPSNTELFGEEFYVDAIGRSCYWNEDYNCYYDEVTDCYFWYNNEFEPACWQYWYEGISSDYDMGWMEYDEDEGIWYINTSYDTWIQLPSKYDTDRLWYIK